MSQRKSQSRIQTQTVWFRRGWIVGVIFLLLLGLGFAMSFLFSNPDLLIWPKTKSRFFGNSSESTPAQSSAMEALNARRRNMPQATQLAKNCTLIISSKPEGATVFIDGIRLDAPTPVTKEVKAGTYLVRLAALGYEEREDKLRLEDGQTLKVSIPLKLAPAAKKSSSEPQTAQIKKKIIKAVVPKTPPPRRQHKEPSRASASSVAESTSGHGFLSVATIPWSTVYFNEKKLGITPLANVRIPSGRHRLRFVGPEGWSIYRQVTIKPEETTKLRLRLSDRPADGE